EHDAREARDREVDAKTAFIQNETLRGPAERLAALMSAEPKLETSPYAIDPIRRGRQHTLSEAEEKLWSATSTAGLNWQFDLYEKLVARHEAFPSQRDLFAFTLMRLASSRTTFARLRHFDDAASWSYFGRELTRPAVKSLLERVAGNATAYKRYQQLRADHPSKTLPPQFTIDQARRTIIEAPAPLGEDSGRELAALLDPRNGRMDVVP